MAHKLSLMAGHIVDTTIAHLVLHSKDLPFGRCTADVGLVVMATKNGNQSW